MKKLVHTPDGVRDIYGDEFKRKLVIEEKIKNRISPEIKKSRLS